MALTFKSKTPKTAPPPPEIITLTMSRLEFEALSGIVQAVIRPLNSYEVADAIKNSDYAESAKELQDILIDGNIGLYGVMYNNSADYTKSRDPGDELLHQAMIKKLKF